MPPKRFSNLMPEPVEPLLGSFVNTINSPDHALRLAKILVEYEHIEDLMGNVLGVLLGGSDHVTAGYVMRSLRSTRGRHDLMKSLLELAPQNVDLGEEYDALLRAFVSVGKARNRYVHARWSTREEDGLTVMAPVDEHGWDWLRTRKVNIAEMDEVLIRMEKLRQQILEVANLELIRRQGRPVPGLPIRGDDELGG